MDMTAENYGQSDIDEELLEAIKRDARLLKNVPASDLKDAYIVEALNDFEFNGHPYINLVKSPEALEANEHMTHDFILWAIKYNPKVFQHLSEHHKTPDICELALARNPSNDE